MKNVFRAFAAEIPRWRIDRIRIRAIDIAATRRAYSARGDCDLGSGDPLRRLIRDYSLTGMPVPSAGANMRRTSSGVTLLTRNAALDPDEVTI